jgi:lambda family phage portal protein
MTIRRTIGNMLKRSGEWIGGIGTSSGYNAGSGSGRWSAGSYLSAPVAQTHGAAGIIGRRSAGAIGNIPIAAALTETQVDSCIPDMPSVRSGHRNESIASALQLGFQALPLLEFFRNMERARFGSGEGLAMMRIDRHRQFSVQHFPAEQLDRTKNVELPDGGRIIAGVETNAQDEVVAYWIFPDAPDLAFAMIGPSQRVPVDDVIHVYEKKFPGQRRGISELTPVLGRIHELEQFQDRLLARAGTAALFGGFITDPSGTAFDDAKPPDNDLSLEPGVLRKLPPGADVRFPAMPDNADAPALLRHYQRDICAGVSVPYELATGDYSMVNYSSAKMGLEAYKRRIKALRAALLVPKMFEVIYRRWVLIEILSGRLHAPDFFRDPAPYFAVSFLFTEWAALDPLKDTQADVAALQSGLRSRAEIIAARGRDIQDVDREIAADHFQPSAPLALTQGTDHANAA